MSLRRPALTAALAAAIVLVTASPALARQVPAAAAGLVSEGRARYDAADYGNALIKFEEAIAKGAVDGELFYQAAYCYRAVREDMDNARLYFEKAVPLLEEKIKGAGKSDLESYYYLSAIYLNEVRNPDRLQAVAREATDGLDAGRIPKPKTAEAFFQAGRLYGFAQKRDLAVKNYEQAIALLEKAPGGAKGTIYMHCLQASGDVAMEQKDWARAAGHYGRILAADPSREEMRIPLALALFRGGKEEEAAKVWEQSRDPRMSDQKAYLSRIARRYVELGRPQPKAPASDDDLRKAIIESAKKYAEARKKDDDAALAASEKWLEERRQEKANRSKKGAKRPAPPPEEDLSGIPLEKMTPEQRLQAMGIKNYDLEPPPPPPSPERLAAESEFMGLLAELVRRGPMIRDWAVTNGLAPAIFK